MNFKEELEKKKNRVEEILDAYLPQPAGEQQTVLEAMRYAHFLKKDGVLIVNDQRMDPMTVVTGAAEYPEDILETLGKDHKVVSIDAMAEAKKLGNARVFNTVIIGVAAKNMDFKEEEWLSVIEKTVPPKTVELNQRAFKAGFEA